MRPRILRQAWRPIHMRIPSMLPSFWDYTAKELNWTFQAFCSCILFWLQSYLCRCVCCLWGRRSLTWWRCSWTAAPSLTRLTGPARSWSRPCPSAQSSLRTRWSTSLVSQRVTDTRVSSEFWFVWFWSLMMTGSEQYILPEKPCVFWLILL